MPKDDGLVANVQSRASSALHNWNRPSNEQSVACYKARHREDRELNQAPSPSRWRYSRGLLLLHCMNPRVVKRCLAFRPVYEKAINKTLVCIITFVDAIIVGPY